ncbi:hypothetical protein ZEAMMB73_Zm00001d027257 [Zea mays]|uniref:Uncharacterized protein n=1 Tax=Zea mays TaxID=4577 RepID=A0A1D6JJC7_MAIZE|nr:hypothetical protein ZEAMMB73_Zm00001d027257 [Zea mays]ONL92448.1 hypothetical protein ZEAMMB73_Zm00001d027257 [Zea mays]
MNPCPTTETECNESVAGRELTCSSTALCYPERDNGSRSGVLTHVPIAPRSSRNNGNLGETLAYREITVGEGNAGGGGLTSRDGW